MEDMEEINNMELNKEINIGDNNENNLEVDNEQNEILKGHNNINYELYGAENQKEKDSNFDSENPNEFYEEPNLEINEVNGEQNINKKKKKIVIIKIKY